MHLLLPVPSDSMMPEAGLPLTLQRRTPPSHEPSPSPSHAEFCAEVQRAFSLICVLRSKATPLEPLCLKKTLPKQAPSSACSPFSTKFLFICFSYSSPLSSCLLLHRPLPSYIHQLTQIPASGLPVAPDHKKHWNMWIIWLLDQSKLKWAQTFTQCVQFTCLSHQLSHLVFTVILWGSDIIPLL